MESRILSYQYTDLLPYQSAAPLSTLSSCQNTFPKRPDRFYSNTLNAFISVEQVSHERPQLTLQYDSVYI